MTERVDQQASNKARQRPRRRPPLPEEAVKSIAAWLAVIAEPTRIRLMEMLNVGSTSVQGLAAQLGTSYQNASRHLGVLHQAGIVRRCKVENRIHYELVDWSGWWMVEQVGVSVTADLDGE